MKTYAVIGDPIDHSLSPTIHNAAFRELGLECTYIAYRIPAGELKEGIESLKKIGISGFNVTVPHKVQMIKYLDLSDKDCTLIGAANTVTYLDGKLTGYNTDMAGFMEPIQRREITIKGEHILLMGAGGAARAITAAFAANKAKMITIANRDTSKAALLVRFAENLGVKSEAISLDEAAGAAASSNFIINATTLGMKGEASPIPEQSIQKGAIVYDIVYRPMHTDLLDKAKKAGAVPIYGYEMLLGQARRAFEIWHGTEAPYDIMKRAILGGSP